MDKNKKQALEDFKEKFKKICEKWNSSAVSKEELKEYRAIYNKDLDKIIENADKIEISYIAIGDNPGNHEKTSCRYMQNDNSTPRLRKFYKILGNHNLPPKDYEDDWSDVNVLVLNKVPISTPTTNNLRRLLEYEDFLKCQQDMADAIKELATNLDVEIHVFGHSSITDYTDYNTEDTKKAIFPKYQDLIKNQKKIRAYYHPSKEEYFEPYLKMDKEQLLQEGERGVEYRRNIFLKD